MDVDEFRSRARRWLAANASVVPYDWGPIVPGDLVGTAQTWQAAMHQAGFAALTWPVEFGGQGLTEAHEAAWVEEAAAAGVPPVLNMVGLVLAANAILAFGSTEQKERLLPPTAAGELVWCQLFSEPGAGSDLAAMTTSARRDGDEYVVDGQKVWTSNGRVAHRGLLLARTTPLAEAPKHKGISCFALDMSAPGVDVRPLRQMNGDADFDEVFLEQVRIPASDLIGPENQGWRVAMATLTNERGFIAGTSVAWRGRVDALQAQARGGDPVPVARVVSVVTAGRTLELLSRRQGPVASVASSLVKLGLAESALEMASARAAAEGAGAMLDGEVARAVVSAPGSRLGGGTSEIQRNIVGERVLGLPPEPKAAP